MVRTISITSWGDYRKLVRSSEFRGWAFRGQSDAAWPVASSLARYLKDFEVHQDAWAFQEKRALRIFQRKAQLYLSSVPDAQDSFQWLAMMQHHGAPTRLIDFTWSPFIAAYFALSQSKTEAAAVWGIFPPNIDHSSRQAIANGQIIDAKSHWMRKPGIYEKHFLPGTMPLVVIGEPEVMNERLTVQSGTFAIPGVLDQSLDSLLSKYPNPGETIVKFELDTNKLRKDAMEDLYNSNIREVTLFPGLDGFARSLAFELEFHWAFDPKTMDKVKGFDSPPGGMP